MRRRGAIALWLLVATVVGWSVFDHLPEADLDRSWAHGLHLAHLDGFRFGGDVVFNYGPLGFIARPVAGTGPLYAVAIAGTLLLTLAAAASIFATFELLNVSLLRNGVLTVLVMLVAPAENMLVELVVTLSAVWLVLRLRQRGPPPPLAFVLFGVAMVALGLIKVSVAPPAVAIVLAVAFVGGRRHVAAALGGAVGGFVVVWPLSGQRFADVASWVRGSSQVALGHVSAMNLDDPSRRWEYAAVVVLVVVTGVIALDAAVRERLRNRDPVVLVTVVVGLILGWFVVRQGFTRHGGRTRLVFFTAAWMLVGWVPWKRMSSARRCGGVVTIIAATVCFAVAAGSVVRLVNPVEPVGDAAESARLLMSPGYRDERVDGARAAVRDEVAVPASMIERIGSAPVLVDPIEITAAWAYDLTWSPLPTLQRYIGYTDQLDDRNAALLSGDRAPRFVLRERFAVIDGRYGPAESPDYVLALYCNYRVVEAGDEWDLLERSPSRCSDATVTSELELEPGQTIDLDPTAPGRARMVSIDFDLRLRDGAASLLLKPLMNPHVVLDGEEFRMLPATSDRPALLSVPDESGWDAGAGLVPDVARLGVDTPARVTIYEMEIVSTEGS